MKSLVKYAFLLWILSLPLTGCIKDKTPAPTPISTKAPAVPTPTPASSTWLYQLQEIDIDKVVQAEGAVAVIDPSRNGDGDSTGFWNAEEIKKVKDSGKTVLAYLAIGEAEDYRDYWKAEWKESPPSFISKPNEADIYEGNFAVKYWEEGWQEVILRRLDRIVDAGFDGVYLDKVDAFEDWEGKAPEGMDLHKEMAAFIERIEERGEAKKPGFQVFLQNGWGVWNEPKVTQSVSGVAIEELSLGWEGEDGSSTPSDVQQEMQEAMVEARRRGWTLLVVDYPAPESSNQIKESAKAQAKRLGALQVLAPRDLDGAF